MPKRIQLSRKKGYRKPADAVNVARPTKWGNYAYALTPASKLDPYSRISAVEAYKVYLERNPGLVEAAKKELRGHDLACWCPLDHPCHAEVLLELANGEAEPERKE